ncbi:hypothetical protein F5Y06DRAFT_298521 [Hypoxylon sp. FL0890]|nr:hypothetical protein F5Y06DRAFT_298521 [Hypoxylon sp. FL0890]
MSSTLALGQMRPVLGQQVDIGRFYDAHRDTFLPINLITAHIPAHLVHFTQAPERKIRIATDDSTAEKFNQLGISRELGASYLAGLIPVRGAARYLESCCKTNGAVQGALYLDSIVEKLEIDLRKGDINDHLSTEASRCKEGTHIVTGVTFGARVTSSMASSHLKSAFAKH